MSKYFIGVQEFQKFHSAFSLRSDGQMINTYEGSDIDTFLENWYNKLPQDIKEIIILVEIHQDTYVKNGTTVRRGKEILTCKKLTSSKSIVRHIFLPSVEEIKCAIDLKNEEDVLNFLLEATNVKAYFKDIWTRDKFSYNEDFSYNEKEECPDTIVMTISHHFCYLFFDDAAIMHGVRPAFVVDVSKL